jgi:hypothetical protein
VSRESRCIPDLGLNPDEPLTRCFAVSSIHLAPDNLQRCFDNDPHIFGRQDAVSDSVQDTVLQLLARHDEEAAAYLTAAVDPPTATQPFGALLSRRRMRRRILRRQAGPRTGTSSAPDG